FDSAGTLYVSNFNTNSVLAVSSVGALSTYATGFSGPEGLVFDNAGELFVANENGNSISKVAPGGGVATTFVDNTHGLVQPQQLTIDGAQNLYVKATNSTIDMVAIASASVSAFASGLNSVTGLAFDKLGNLYASNFTVSTIDEIS